MEFGGRSKHPHTALSGWWRPVIPSREAPVKVANPVKLSVAWKESRIESRGLWSGQDPLGVISAQLGTEGCSLPAGPCPKSQNTFVVTARRKVLEHSDRAS